MKAVGKTDKGLVRRNNEDAFAVFEGAVGPLPNLYVVADGMGGHSFGEVASSAAIELFVKYISSLEGQNDIMDILTEGVQFSNSAVYNLSVEKSEYVGMGTTLTAFVAKGGKGYAAHVGDSRLYHISDNEMRLITSDHTYVSEMVKAGKISKKEALTHPRRNVLTRALGTGHDILVDGYLFEIQEGDKIIMCTDGLTNMVSEAEILNIINSGQDMEETVLRLLEAANNNGGLDNITVILTGCGR